MNEQERAALEAWFDVDHGWDFKERMRAAIEALCAAGVKEPT